MGDDAHKIVICVMVGAAILIGLAAYRAQQAKKAKKAAEAFVKIADELDKLKDYEPPSEEEVAGEKMPPPAREELQAQMGEMQRLNEELKQQDPVYRLFSGVMDNVHQDMQAEIQRTITESLPKPPHKDVTAPEAPAATPEL